MIALSHEEFEKVVAAAMDAIPKSYQKHMNNVGFVIENNPTPEQRAKLHLHDGQLLFGLYEGIPLTKRGSGYNLVLPDKITIFKEPIEAISHDKADLEKRVANTIWHEVAHHYGLGHDRIHKIEDK